MSYYYWKYFHWLAICDTGARFTNYRSVRMRMIDIHQFVFFSMSHLQKHLDVTMNRSEE